MDRLIPYGDCRASCMFGKLYAIETINENPVKDPTMTVAMTAFGISFLGRNVSSARWRVASSAIKENCGVDSPIKKKTPSGQPPEELTKLAHT